MSKKKVAEKIPVIVRNNIVVLPQVPFDEDYEDFISAYLISAGYEVETQLIKRENKRSVLEIDIIFTTPLGEKRWIEVKSAGWSIDTLYAMAGKQKAYCPVNASLIYKDIVDDGKTEAAEKVAEQLDIELVGDTHSDLEEVSKKYPHLYSRDNEKAIPFLRLAFYIERALAKEISEERKLHKNIEAYEALSYFWRYCKHYSYFAKDASQRGLDLINVFSKYRNLTARIANMNCDGTLSNDTNIQIPENIFKRITYNCQERDVLYGSQLAELTCRLKIIRSVVDHILSPKIGSTRKTWLDRLPEQLLNLNLHHGVSLLKDNPFIGQYPHFWQVFIYLFGGFLIEEHKDEEYEILNKLTGIPLDKIDEALKVFDILFPTPSGWFVSNQYSGVYHLKHVPIPLMGIGAISRIQIFCKSKGLSTRTHYTNEYLRKDMKKWMLLTLKYIKSNARLEN